MIKIAGTGAALPKNCVTSSSLDLIHGYDGSLAEVTGVDQRYVVDQETQIDLAKTASLAALQDAGLAVTDIDTVISGCAVPYQSLPATAPLIMQRLGIVDGAASAFDVNSTCLSFLTGIDMAAGLIVLGRANAVLVVASEIASRALPWSTAPETAALFGDGAGAAVITKGETPYSALMRTYPSAYNACQLGAGGTRFDYHNDPVGFAENARFRMDGKALFRLSAAHFTDFVDELLMRAGWEIRDVDLVVPHQASPHALRHMIRQLGVPREKVIDISATVGNQIAASLPITLDHARRNNRIKDGTKLLMLGTSAGVSFGGLAMEVSE
ncbi:MAG: 3-oxoacyl-[acyl-carrier-protein] synthase III C-terminal domain-containing protein [Yoonia sp.]|uniref:3-oxoacyl-[acyl-carrier-protein] synthase III C-terminal domain-containing protein n=1 Tax=Yoonia sp. TaxID=2212373 RepID=UPI0032670BE9